MKANDDNRADLRESAARSHQGMSVRVIQWATRALFATVLAASIHMMGKLVLTGFFQQVGAELFGHVKERISALSRHPPVEPRTGIVAPPSATDPPRNPVVKVGNASARPLRYEMSCGVTGFDVASLEKAIADELAQHQTSAQLVVQLRGGMSNLLKQEDGAAVRASARFNVCLDPPSSECPRPEDDCSAQCSYSKASTSDANRKFVNDALRELIVSSVRQAAGHPPSTYTQGNLCDAL